MSCKGNSFYKLLMRLGMEKEAEIYWKNHLDIEGIIWLEDFSEVYAFYSFLGALREGPSIRIVVQRCLRRSRRASTRGFLWKNRVATSWKPFDITEYLGETADTLREDGGGHAADAVVLELARASKTRTVNED